jgi:DNA-binding beta-propeller fold protein YncE
MALRCSLVITLLFLTACATPVPFHKVEPSAELQWPRQPAGPKVAWVRSIANYQDAGIAKSFWRRTLEFITGADERRIVRPYGILFDEAERLFIADPGAGVVHSMDIKAGQYTVLGGDRGSPLRTPIGLTEDDQGRLYITDSTARAVFRHDPTDGSLKELPLSGLFRPTGIAFSRFNGFLYIVDTIGNQVIVADTNGHERSRFGAAGDESGQFNHPTDIAIDNLGQVYVTDALNYKIMVFTAAGLPVTQFGSAGDAAGDLNKPKGVAVDSERHIYVCDAMLDAVQVFDVSGQLLNSFGGTGTGNGAFWMPSGLFIDRRDFIFVSDTYNQRVQVFKYIAGDGKKR